MTDLTPLRRFEILEAALIYHYDMVPEGSQSEAEIGAVLGEVRGQLSIARKLEQQRVRIAPPLIAPADASPDAAQRYLAERAIADGQAREVWEADRQRQLEVEEQSAREASGAARVRARRIEREDAAAARDDELRAAGFE